MGKVLIEQVRKSAKPQTLTQHVANELREMILSGELEEGSKLRQDTLASMLHVSRIPVREALRQLEAEGLVTFFPHRGAIVSDLSPDEIGEVFDARALIESDLLRRAIPNMTPRCSSGRTRCLVRSTTRSPKRMSVSGDR